MTATFKFPSHSLNHFITTEGDIIFTDILGNLLLILLRTSNCCMKVNDKFEKMWKEGTIVYLNYYHVFV